jgi:transposase-like protein
MIQETITHQCSRCSSTNIVRNGKNRYGKQQYRCKDCGKQAVLNPSVKYTQEQQEQILATYHERPSMRGIQRIYGVSRGTLSNWLKKKPKPAI